MSTEPFAARLTTIWIGSFFLWMLKGFKGKYSEMIQERFEKRNTIVGYIIEILIVLLFLYFLYFMQKEK